jgi:ribosomal protein L39E
MESNKKKTTQKQRLLNLLRKRAGHFVSVWDVVMTTRSLQYNARIKQLRDDWHIIHNETKRVKNKFGEKMKYSFYKLIEPNENK